MELPALFKGQRLFFFGCYNKKGEQIHGSVYLKVSYSSIPYTYNITCCYFQI